VKRWPKRARHKSELREQARELRLSIAKLETAVAALETALHVERARSTCRTS
jgi:hypothetical protein